jgi:RNA polymerase sigma factor (sigma-70 family)
LKHLDDILKGCLKNNKADQEKLYSLMAKKMYGLCLRYASSSDEAQDMMQEGFITVFNKLSTYKGQGSLEGWIRKIMVHAAIDKYRGRIYQVSIDDIQVNGQQFSDSNSGPEQLSAKEILGLIQQLPAQYRLVFNMYVLEGYSHKEIAEKLSISESTSRSNLTRARALLQAKMKATTSEIERAI